MIGFERQDALVKEVTASVLDPDNPTCWNIVIPPGFGEDEFCEALVADLSSHSSKPLVALLGADEIKDSEDYVKKLYSKWQQDKYISIEPAKAVPTSIEEVTQSIPPTRVGVQILSRFHKFLHRLDVSILGTLRSEEHAHHLRTVTISPVPYYELKKIWDRDRLLVNSDYGDTHTVWQVKPSALEEVKCKLRDKEWPETIIEFVYGLTGGYPKPFSLAMKSWKNRGKPSFDEKEMGRAKEIVANGLLRFVDWLDRPYGGSRFRDLVVDLYQGYNVEQASVHLACHPWKDILLEGDQLRAECVGEAAIKLMTKEALQRGEEKKMFASVSALAKAMYARRQYGVVLKLLDVNRLRLSGYPFDILGAHAKVMCDLYGCEGSRIGIDTNWSGVRRSIEKAIKILKKHLDKIGKSEAFELRYEELEILAHSIIKAQKVNPRVVDVLAGILDVPANCTNHKAAAVFLLLQYEASQAMPGHSSACQSATALPEQIFRVWAFWALRLTYYEVPADQDDVWEEVRRIWPHESLEKPEAGKSFYSFEAFAYFAVALFFKTRPTNKMSIADDFKSLSKDLGTFGPVRRDHAHAVCMGNARKRKKYFEIIDRWLGCMISACPEVISRDQLLGAVDPLPLPSSLSGRPVPIH